MPPSLHLSAGATSGTQAPIAGLLPHSFHTSPSLLLCLSTNLTCAGGCAAGCAQQQGRVGRGGWRGVPAQQAVGAAASCCGGHEQAPGARACVAARARAPLGRTRAPCCTWTARGAAESPGRGAAGRRPCRQPPAGAWRAPAVRRRCTCWCARAERLRGGSGCVSGSCSWRSRRASAACGGRRGRCGAAPQQQPPEPGWPTPAGALRCRSLALRRWWTTLSDTRAARAAARRGERASCLLRWVRGRPRNRHIAASFAAMRPGCLPELMAP